MINGTSKLEAEKADSEDPEIVEIVLDPDTVYKVTITCQKLLAIFTIYSYNTGDKPFRRAGGRERRL